MYGPIVVAAELHLGSLASVARFDLVVVQMARCERIESGRVVESSRVELALPLQTRATGTAVVGVVVIESLVLLAIIGAAAATEKRFAYAIKVSIMY